MWMDGVEGAAASKAIVEMATDRGIVVEPQSRPCTVRIGNLCVRSLFLSRELRMVMRGKPGMLMPPPYRRERG
jgi:hypothetical protein